MTKREAEELLELSRKATAGPWTDDVDGVYGASEGDCEYCRYNPAVARDDAMSGQDWTFIVAARNRVESLVQMLQQAMEVLAAADLAGDPVHPFVPPPEECARIDDLCRGLLLEWNKPEPAKGEEPKP